MYLGNQIKITRKMIQEVKNLVSLGLSDNGVARNLGITKPTLDRWLEIGKTGDPLVCTELHRELWIVYSYAKSHLELSLVEGIKEDRDWRSSAWLLERQFREDYNPKINDLVESELKRIVDKLSEIMPDSAFDELIYALNYLQKSELPEGAQESGGETQATTIDIEVLSTPESTQDLGE